MKNVQRRWIFAVTKNVSDPVRAYVLSGNPEAAISGFSEYASRPRPTFIFTANINVLPEPLFVRRAD